MQNDDIAAAWHNFAQKVAIIVDNEVVDKQLKTDWRHLYDADSDKLIG